MNIVRKPIIAIVGQYFECPRCGAVVQFDKLRPFRQRCPNRDCRRHWDVTMVVTPAKSGLRRIPRSYAELPVEQEAERN